MESILVDGVIILIIGAFTYWGHHKGFVYALSKLLNFFFSLIIIFFIYKPITNVVIKKSQADELLSQKISTMLMKTDIENGNIINEESTNMSKGIIKVINSLLKDAILDAKGSIVGYISNKLAYIIISILVIIALVMAMKFGLRLVTGIAEFLAKLPIIRIFNRWGGLLYGLLKGFFVVYILLAIISIISPLIADMKVLDAIKNSVFVSKMYDNNLLLKIIKY